MTASKAMAVAAIATLVTISGAGAQIRDRSAERQRQAPLIGDLQHARPGQEAKSLRSAPRPYLAPHLVSAIREAPLLLLTGADSGGVDRRMHYVLGFSLAADKACDFLTVAGFRRVVGMVTPAVETAAEMGRERANDARLEHMTAGLRDGAAFVALNGCGSAAGRQIARSLTALWQAV